LNTAHRSQAVNATRGDGQIYTGACRLQSISVTADAAVNSAAIYDGTSTSGTLLFDPQLGVAKSSTYIDCKGAPVSTGIYQDTNSTTPNATLVSIVYDY
jgi:hypothetical protein